MMTNTRFGKKLKVPSTVQLKHQLLLSWLTDQQHKEATESSEDETARRGTMRTAVSDAEKVPVEHSIASRP